MRYMIRNSLFTSNSKLIARFLQRLVTVGAAALVLFLVLHIFDYLYVKEDNWTRILWHNYYRAENIDNVFLGSSHVHCDIDPFILDEMNGMENFNMSIPFMRLNGAYYVLREMAGDHDLKNVYLELYYVPSTGEWGDVMSDVSLQWNWNITDHMRPSINKIQFMLSMSRRDKYLDTLFPFIRYREHIFDTPYISEQVGLKTSDDYRNYKLRYENENGEPTLEYRDKGYHYNLGEMPEYTMAYPQEINLQTEGAMPSNTEEYLRKIIEYCQEKDIGITLFINPIYETQILSTIDYDDYHQQILTIADEYEIPFYDFNLCKSEYLDIMRRENFADAGHLNSVGAELFTPFLWEVLSGDSESNQEYFCQTYGEKILLDAPETYGLYYFYDGDAREYTIASNRETEIEYKVTATTEEGEERIIQDFCVNKEFELQNGEHGMLTIVSRIKEQPEELRTLEIKY